jgi:hypothetical protein
MNDSSISRRHFLRIGGGVGAGIYVMANVGPDVLWPRPASAATAGPGLSDPSTQPKFT